MVLISYDPSSFVSWSVVKSLLTTRGVGQICYWAISGEGIPRVDSTDQADQADYISRPSPAAVGVGPTVRHAQETWRHMRPWEAFWLYQSQWTMIDDHPPIMGNQPMIFDGRIFGSMGWAMWGLWPIWPLSTVAGNAHKSPCWTR